MSDKLKKLKDFLECDGLNQPGTWVDKEFKPFSPEETILSLIEALEIAQKAHKDIAMEPDCENGVQPSVYALRERARKALEEIDRKLER